MIRLVLVGASGRMGQGILQLLPEFPDLKLTGVVVPERHMTRMRQQLPTLAGAQQAHCESSLLPVLTRGADLVIDFSVAGATRGNLQACVQQRVPLLLGTTGLDEETRHALDAAAPAIALLVAANTSLGVNLLIELVRQAAAALPNQFDIEILETHHRSKLDAPSGTALALGAAAAEGREVDLKSAAVLSRQSASAARPAGQIGFAVVRGGDVVGEHQVQFLGAGERLQLAHSATDRAVFARGALVAGQWLAGRPPGRYKMSDVFRKGTTKQ